MFFFWKYNSLVSLSADLKFETHFATIPIIYDIPNILLNRIGLFSI